MGVTLRQEEFLKDSPAYKIFEEIKVMIDVEK
jgi:hypothetical protein